MPPPDIAAPKAAFTLLEPWAFTAALSSLPVSLTHQETVA
jgi:hypothetical protein